MIGRTVWRVVFADRPNDVLRSARAPCGRFHRRGQVALYGCLAEEGLGVSISRYVSPGDPPRVAARLTLIGGRIFDLPASGSAEDSAVARERWDLDLDAGRRPGTWQLSDRIRGAGFDGMIYPSRLRPDLRNIVLFRWNCRRGPDLRPAAAPRPWSPPR